MTWSGHLINQFFDPVLSFKLWSRVKHLMPNVQGLAAAGLNEHLRFLRYGEALRRHYGLCRVDSAVPCCVLF